MTHSPTPWTASCPRLHWRIKTAQGQYVAEYISNAEDAAFIERAANYHDRLVEALEKSRRIVVQDDGWCLVCMNDADSPADHGEDCPAWFARALLAEIRAAE